MRGSDTRIFLPKINGIDGHIRQRYPLMPVSGVGYAFWKKMNIIKDEMSLKEVKNQNKYFSTGVSHSSSITGHTHIIEISNDDYAKLMSGDLVSLKVTAQTANAHVYELTVSKKDGKLYTSDCDGNWVRDNIKHPNQVCMDYHENTLSN